MGGNEITLMVICRLQYRRNSNYLMITVALLHVHIEQDEL